MSSHKKILARTDAADIALLEAENTRLRTAIMRVIGWLEAEACAADAKNYRATADNLRQTLAG